MPRSVRIVTGGYAPAEGDDTIRRMTESALFAGEDEETFLLRRAVEERRKMAETACVIRALHEDMAETYEDLLRSSRDATAEIEALAARIG